MSVRNIWIVFAKELKDITRDRRTLMFMIILPLAAAPLLMVVMGKLLAFGVRQVKESPSRIAVFGAENSPKTMGLLEAMADLQSYATKAPLELTIGLASLVKQEADPVAGLIRAAGIESGASITSLLTIVPAPGDREATRKAIEDKQLEAAVVIPPGFDADVASEKPTKLTIDFDSSFDKSKQAQRKLSVYFEAYGRGVVKTRLPKHDLDATFLEPIDIELDSVASKKRKAARSSRSSSRTS